MNNEEGTGLKGQGLFDFIDDWNVADSVVNALVIGGLIIGGILALASLPVLGVGLLIAGVALAVIEYNDDREGNVLNHPDNIMTAVGIGASGIGFVTGSWTLGLMGLATTVVSSNDGLFNTLFGDNNILIFVVLAAVCYWIYTKSRNTTVKNGNFLESPMRWLAGSNKWLVGGVVIALIYLLN